MSPRLSLSIAASLVIAAVPAAPVLAKSKSHAPARPVPAAAEGSTTLHPMSGLGRLVPSSVRLSLAKDAKVDVRSERGVKVAKRSALKHHRAVLPAGKSVNARILLLAATGDEPTFTWWKSMLTTEGVPFDAIVTRDASPLTTQQLQLSATKGRYEGIVLATTSLTDCSVSPCADTMTPDAWTALQSYEASFNVRELDAYGWPSPANGTNWGGNCGDKSGMTETVTAAGKSTFADLTGTVPVDKGVWGCETSPLAGSSWQTLVAGPNGAVVGTSTRADGVETMFNSVDGSDWTIHTQLLFHGMLNWLTKGIYLGTHRNFLGIDVDDIFLSNDRWDPATHDLNPDENSVIRMKPADVLRAIMWEQHNNLTLNLLFNGSGADPATSSRHLGDPFSNAILLAKNQFTWENHTWTHPVLDQSSQATIESEIKNNITFAQKYDLPGFDRTELVTGGHTGLTNPAMPKALSDTGIKTIGADASYMPNQTAVGPATTDPRHPTGIYYNVGTKAEELDEYNYLNYTVCGGGPACISAPVDWNGYVNNEATIILRHVLGNDPRPHFVHQSNLAEDGTMYPVMDEVLRRYHAYVNTPLTQLSATDEAGTLQQQGAWTAAVAAGKVTGTITAAGLSVTSTIPNLMVPVSGTRAGTTYGGVRSGWQKVGAGTISLGA
ncbi:MAG: hypothetical protein JWM71_1017 [Solirubrobacteraceae bacterium]|nr:hypothetical protein [Solirubrobacteraceae bacterium]